MSIPEMIKKCHEFINAASDDPHKIKIIYAFLTHLH